ncbi:uncharacterized protein IWZ02DRAFT_462023 [Phyllosticta citriasiana]|uniref:uncharacterized protein n=1 Tax=Phyllosticta citriasiana TaxID=595635 RepID=UPI0030FD3E35
MPGWLTCRFPSWGYHSDDGKTFQFFNARKQTSQVLPMYFRGDTVGAGVDLAAQRIFFTKNGELFGEFKLHSLAVLHG